MKKLTSMLVLPVLLIAAAAAAEAPIAMRVEVEPQGFAGGNTTIRVVIQVSPEDRTRLGRNAIVRIELDGEVPRGQSPMFAVRIEDDGSADVETAWPPGEHELRVGIESPDGSESGLWVGRVRIPGEAQEPAPQPTPVPTPEVPPVPEPKPEPVAASMSEPEYADETSDEPIIAAAAAATTTAAAVAEAPPAAPKEPPPRQPEPKAPEQEVPQAEPVVVPAEEPEPEATTSETEPEPEIEKPVAAAPVPEEPSPPLTEEPAASPVEEAQTPEPEPASESVVQEPEVAIVEPLRGETVPPPTTTTGAEAATPALETKAETQSDLTPDVVAAYESWALDGAGTTELTAIITRSRQPAEGLTADELQLKIGGSVVGIDRLGNAGNAPLLLGLAFDISPENIGRWSSTGRRLEALIARTRGGRGELFVSTVGAEGDWGAGADRVAEVVRAPSSGDLPGLLTTSLGQFEDQRGRCFLLIVTDGRTEATKAQWRNVVTAAETGGVPVLVIALWDEDFKTSIRKQLQNIASASGGRLFLAQGPDQLDSAAERYGIALDAGVAVRFELPTGLKPSPAISLTSNDRSLDVAAPARLR